MDKNTGTRGQFAGKESSGGLSLKPPEELKPSYEELGINKYHAHQWQTIASLPEEELIERLEETKASGKEITTAGVYRDVKREYARAEAINNLENINTLEAKAIEGVYDVVVIDPPWEMKKIERDVAPSQVEFDYPTMNEFELSNLEIPCADDCHVWLWTTHKHMPMAFNLLNYWNLNYICTFVWHKPGGFQPFGLPQYNCEFALYARKGSPTFFDLKDFNTCFSGKRNGHSTKPDEFYAIVKRVTAGRRLDMFSRRSIDGFDGWGNEA